MHALLAIKTKCIVNNDDEWYPTENPFPFAQSFNQTHLQSACAGQTLQIHHANNDFINN